MCQCSRRGGIECVIVNVNAHIDLSVNYAVAEENTLLLIAVVYVINHISNIQYILGIQRIKNLYGVELELEQ